MQANKRCISTGLHHIFAIVSSQISTMMEPFNAILEHETTNRRYGISPRDISFLSSLSIIHASFKTVTPVYGGNDGLCVHRGKMSDWSTRDHVTLPNSKWRQYLHSLFIPVERRLIAASYELQMHIRIFLE